MKAVDSLSSIFLENNDEKDHEEMTFKAVKDNPQLLKKLLICQRTTQNGTDWLLNNNL